MNDSTKINVTVHILHHGLPLCGFSTSVPKDWPKDHLWVSKLEMGNANCSDCIAKSHEPLDQ